MDRAFEESKDEEESANDYEEEPVADTEEEEEALGPSEAAESWHVQPRSKHAARPGSAPSQANVAGLRRRLQSSEDRLRRLEQAGGAQVQNQRNFMALASLTTLIGRQQWQSPWMPPMPMGFPMLMQPPPSADARIADVTSLGTIDTVPTQLPTSSCWQAVKQNLHLQTPRRLCYRADGGDDVHGIWYYIAALRGVPCISGRACDDLRHP
jgi:hypothetical protein